MKIKRIAAALGCRVTTADGEVEVERIASLEDADPRSIVFIAHPKLALQAAACPAEAVITQTGHPVPGKISLELDDPYLGYARTAQLFEDLTPLYQGRHASAIIDETAWVDKSASVGPGTVIGKNCRIGPGTRIGAACVVEHHSTIGADCRIDSGAVIRRDTRIGDRVIIQSGTVIGSEGFGNARDGERYVRIPCFGAVVIEDDVEIGAGCTIDRGNFKPTILHRGVRLDNLIHIAHNVEVGEHTAMAAQVGISGSTKVGRGVMIGGQAGFVGHITIGDHTFIGAQAGVSKSVPPGSKVTGYPARNLMTMRRIEAAMTALPEALKEIKRLRSELDQLKQSVMLKNSMGK